MSELDIGEGERVSDKVAVAPKLSVRDHQFLFQRRDGMPN
jgi:hypothetical protein